MKTIGIIGGTSWHSTLEYYKTINKEVARALGAHHSAPIVLNSLNFSPIVEAFRIQD